MGLRELVKHYSEFMGCLTDNVKGGHLPSARLVVELIRLLEREVEVGLPEELPSLAGQVRREQERMGLEARTAETGENATLAVR